VFAIALFAFACSSKSNETPTAELVDNMFADFSTGNKPGVAVMLVHNGKVVLQKSYGNANLELMTPITADTAFRLASVSKQFAAMAILILQQDGALSIDDPVSQYVPELAPYGDVTIRHILLHTGGMPDYYDGIDTSAGMPTNADAAVVLGEMASPLFAAGEKYAYSNSGYDMLGPVVEAAAGMPFVEFVQQRIFDVAGMTSSVVHDHTLPEVKNRAIGYDPSGDGFQLNDADPLNGIVGSGGIYSTLNDMFMWDQALYGEKLISEELQDLAFSSGRSNDGELLNYGFGWRVDTLDGHKRLRHSGSWVGFRTHIVRIPDLKFAAVMLSNRSDFEAEGYIDEITSSYLKSVQ
jgi:CubicO group peptidase (beta-lactamase class C family)